MMRQIRKQNLTIALLAAVLSLWLAASSSVFALSSSVVTRIVTNPLTGIAIDGFDPVSYFTEDEPKQGVPDHEYIWSGVSWYFASAANREIFVRNPEIYGPQFGGHCAMSLARGYLSDGNPRVYLVVGQRLYLFYSGGNRDAFVMSPSEALEEAKARWPNLSKELSSQ
jgi:YHS domain-containing protein